MPESEKILVLEKNTTNKIKIKGSQFIGYAYLVNTKEEALEQLEKLKKEFYDATHHTYAYKLKNGEEKFSDDGEPNGTAGVRILNSINHFGLTDILVVVVRYFGGTKLGIGPLGKAYGDTALNLLEESKKIELTKYEEIKIIYQYDNTSSIHYLLNKYECKKINNIYTSSPCIKCLIEPKNTVKFDEDLIEKTSGNAELQRTNSEFYFKF